MNKGQALVIGASGGLGQECVAQLQASNLYTQVHGVSRQTINNPVQGVRYAQIQSADENQIAAYCQKFANSNQPLVTVICCVGALHFEAKEQAPVMPEKRLEDLSAEHLSLYYLTNAVIPAMWIKHLVPVMKSRMPAHLVCFSARVGSIEDNRLGGWYGYRASKAALNMLIKSAQIECHRRAKNLCLLSYHPGTVDTELSQPFQHNVPKDKLFSTEFSVSQLLTFMPKLSAEQGPHFIDWQGKSIAW